MRTKASMAVPAAANPGKLLAGADTLLHWLELGLAWLSGLILASLVGAIVYDVLGRTLARSGAPWVVEVSEYSMVYLTCLAAPWLYRLNGHVALEVLVDRLPARVRHRLEIATAVLSAAAAFTFMWFAYGVVLNNYERGVMLYNMLVVPRWLVMAPIPLSFLLLGVECVRKVILLAVKR